MLSFFLFFPVKRTSKRRKRAIDPFYYGDDLKVDFRAFRCYYDNCIPPPDPLAVTATPGNALPWSSLSSWDFRNGSKPVQGDNVTIPSGQSLPLPPSLRVAQFGLILFHPYTQLSSAAAFELFLFKSQIFGNLPKPNKKF